MPAKKFSKRNKNETNLSVVLKDKPRFSNYFTTNNYQYFREKSKLQTLKVCTIIYC